mgnify:FL=1
MTEKKNFYPVFTNKITNEKLVYYPVKKNANSSAKLFFARHLGIEHKFFFLEDDIPRINQTEKLHSKYKDKINLVDFYESKHMFEKINVEFKSCIIRDPVKRFVSAFKNRILFHRDKEFYDHDVDLIIDKLENGLFENKHFLPQNYWLGDNLNFFNIIGDVSNIENFTKEINNFFDKKISFPKIQTSGKEFIISLNIDQIKKIKKIYSNDYDLIGNRIKGA